MRVHSLTPGLFLLALVCGCAESGTPQRKGPVAIVPAGDAWVPQSDDQDQDGVAASEAPIAKGDVNRLLQRLAASADERERARIVGEGLWDSNDPKVDSALKARLSADLTEEAFYTAWYLAKRGNQDALAILNANNFKYPVSSWQWSYAIKVFAKHNYRPAIPTLIQNLNAASLNVVLEADAGLRTFCPGSPDLPTLRETREYFQKRWEEESLQQKATTQPQS